MRVYISYSSGSSIAHCFWRYFFQSCGVWVTSQKMKKNWRIDKNKKPQLVILDNKTQEMYETPSPGIVYCFKKLDSTQSERKDFFEIRQWERAHSGVLRQLLEGDENLDDLLELISIFSGTYNRMTGKLEEEGLWSAVWLFHEIAQPAENRGWDQEIREKAEWVVRKLQATPYTLKKSWHHQYMWLYCRYLQCGVNRSTINRMNQCKNLLEQCGELAEKEKGEKYTLSFLAGKISLLTAAENKTAVYYFKDMVRYEPKPDTFYEIGHIYEKAYGDYGLAMEYYKKAYQMDSGYYRSLYKLAGKLERSEEWERAIGIYIKIDNIIGKVKLKNSISIRDFEYEYKTSRKLLWLISVNMDEPKLEDALIMRISDMRSNPDRYVNFEKLFQKMFSERNRQAKLSQMKGELKEKLNQDFCMKA